MRRVSVFSLLLAAAVAGAPRADRNHRDHPLTSIDADIRDHAARLVRDGREIFRYDTFGSEAFWGGALRLHESVATLTPRAALALGLKVDAGALPADVVDAVRRGAVNLDDPADHARSAQARRGGRSEGNFGGDGKLRIVGIQCALCHSTVDHRSRRPQSQRG